MAEATGAAALRRESADAGVCSGLRGALICSCAAWLSIAATIIAMALVCKPANVVDFCTGERSQGASLALDFLVLATTSLACSWIGLYLVFAGSALVGYRGVDSAKRAIMVGEPYFTVYRYAGRTLTGFGVLAGLPWAVYVVSTLLGTGVLDKGCSGLSIGIVLAETAVMMIAGAFSLAGMLCGVSDSPRRPTSRPGGRESCDYDDPTATEAQATGYNSGSGSSRGGRAEERQSMAGQSRASRFDPGSVMTGRTGGTREPLPPQ